MVFVLIITLLSINFKIASDEELKNHCRDNLADYKIPKHIRPVSELPLTGAGKLNRNAVAAIFA